MKHWTLTPTEACREIGHETVWVQANAAGDKVEGCGTCTVAWKMAHDETGDVKLADRFVKMLRTIVKVVEKEDDGDG